MKSPLRKLGVPAVALAGMLALFTPSSADARVRIGAGVGLVPYPANPHPYPYYGPSHGMESRPRSRPCNIGCTVAQSVRARRTVIPHSAFLFGTAGDNPPAAGGPGFEMELGLGHA